MADPHTHPDTDKDDDTGPGLDRGSTPSTPRGVSVLAIIIVIVLVLLIVVLHLTGTIGAGAHS